MTAALLHVLSCYRYCKRALANKLANKVNEVKNTK